MKNIGLALIVILLLSSCNSSQSDQSKIEEKIASDKLKEDAFKDKIIGTWLFVSSSYDGKLNEDDGQDKTKFISKNCFYWISVNKHTKQIKQTLGGNYTFDGVNFVENIEIVAFEGESKYLNTKGFFTIKAEGNKLMFAQNQEGGHIYEEIWERDVK